MNRLIHLMIASLVLISSIVPAKEVAILGEIKSSQFINASYPELLGVKEHTVGFGSAIEFTYSVDEYLFGNGNEQIAFYDFSKNGAFPEFVTKPLAFFFLKEVDGRFFILDAGYLDSEDEVEIVCGLSVDLSDGNPLTQVQLTKKGCYQLDSVVTAIKSSSYLKKLAIKKTLILDLESD